MWNDGVTVIVKVVDNCTNTPKLLRAYAVIKTKFLMDHNNFWERFLPKVMLSRKLLDLVFKHFIFLLQKLKILHIDMETNCMLNYHN